MEYPLALVKNDLKVHSITVNEYSKEILNHFYKLSNTQLPDLSLINTQPELTANLRQPLLDFLLKIVKKTKLSLEIFYQSIKLFDRYCSKRVILKNQAQLIGCTCIWIVSKFEGGYNHSINSLNKLKINGFNGPQERFRIPKLIEFIQLCGPICNYNKNMFIQMEKHILMTLNWELGNITTSNFIFNNIEDNQLILPHKNLNILKNYYLKNFLLLSTNYQLEFLLIDQDYLGYLIIKLSTILILNDENNFKIDLNYLNESNNNMIYKKLNDKFQNFNINNDLTNLIKSIAYSSNTLIQMFTSTNYKEINEMILKIHKICISHLMALKNEVDRSPSNSSIYSNNEFDDNYSDSSINSSPESLK